MAGVGRRRYSFDAAAAVRISSRSDIRSRISNKGFRRRSGCDDYNRIRVVSIHSIIITIVHLITTNLEVTIIARYLLNLVLTFKLPDSSLLRVVQLITQYKMKLNYPFPRRGAHQRRHS